MSVATAISHLVSKRNSWNRQLGVREKIDALPEKGNTNSRPDRLLDTSVRNSVLVRNPSSSTLVEFCVRGGSTEGAAKTAREQADADPDSRGPARAWFTRAATTPFAATPSGGARNADRAGWRKERRKNFMTIASSKCLATLGRGGIYCIKGRIFRLDPLRGSFVFERFCPCETCVKATHREKRIKKIASLMLRSETPPMSRTG